FGQAAVRLLTAMRDNDWPEERIQIHADMWLALEVHEWCHDTCEHRQRAPLLYQAHVRKKWHEAISTKYAFSLAIINEEVLEKYCKELV
ncbi:hypothetical protein PAXRUDRAFT_76249, partial [Paxillus rubicundulus Ve08.2h10]